MRVNGVQGVQASALHTQAESLLSFQLLIRIAIFQNKLKTCYKLVQKVLFLRFSV
jgi:hypothetical protein